MRAYNKHRKGVFSMQNYILCCGSTADLSAQRLKERNIEYIPFHFFLDGKEYTDDLGQTITYPDFYAAMARGAMTRTSQTNADEFEKSFTPWLESGKDIVYVSLSSGISGSYNSALIAQKALEEKFPDRKVYIVDSLGASSGYGLFMEELADRRDEGMSAAHLAIWAEQNRLRVNHWFFSTDLTFYVRGGRISKAMGWFGTIFRICPLLNMDNLGRLIPRRKIRTKAKVIQEIAETMVEYADNGAAYNGRCYISHAACLDDAVAVKNLVEKYIPALKDKVEIFDVGTTIGAHTGPGTVALFFLGKVRQD